LDDLILFLVSAVVGVLLPVVDINIGDTANQKLEFTLVENIDQISRDQFVEAGDESIELFFDAFLDLPFREESVCEVSGPNS
jgi:hypothetical protein